jgi:hypothetical protein
MHTESSLKYQSMPAGGHGKRLVGFGEFNESVISPINLHVALAAQEHDIRGVVVGRILVHMMPLGFPFTAHLAWFTWELALCPIPTTSNSDIVALPSMVFCP